MKNASEKTTVYNNPLLERYASKEVSFIFSPDFKFSTWRKLWICLAQSQMELGLPITPEQIAEMNDHIHDIDYDKAATFEAQTRHDVMAHILTFGEACPLAKPIIHLGATSAFVADNTDLIQMKEAGAILLRRLSTLIFVLRDFALRYKDLATLGFTHFQPAQLTTVGKRACLWLLDLSMDFKALDRFTSSLPLLGAKGTTGTQASFLKLFEGNADNVKKLDMMIARTMGFDTVVPVSGQTYSRKIDAEALSILSGLAQSLHKLANDVRLLQHLREMEEPFETSQVGSSAMAYKRNPMRSERMTSLARYILSLSSSPAMTAAEQWFERTLDDSANKRLSIPEGYLAADACLILAHNICNGAVVYPGVIQRHVREEMPFMASENILMEAVKKGGDRQLLHERIRAYSMDAQKGMKTEGKKNDLLERIEADPAFRLSPEDLARLINPLDFIGLAPQQVIEFIENTIDPLLKKSAGYGTIANHELTV